MQQLAVGEAHAAAVPPVAKKAPTSPWLALYIALAVLTLTVFGFALGRPIQVLPRLGPAPSFALMDQNGQPFRSTDLSGRVTLFHFFYTRCSTCSAMTAHMRLLQERLRAQRLLGSSVVLASITLDPEHDTPQVLRSYAARFGADPQAWHFLTGDRVHTKMVVGAGFGVYYENTPGSSVVAFHDHRFILVDGSGLVRAEYRDTTPDPDRVLRDIQLVLREAATQGPMRLVYEAAHVFACYPR